MMEVVVLICCWLKAHLGVSAICKVPDFLPIC